MDPARPPSDGPPGPRPPEHVARVRQAVYEFLSRRQRGEDISPEQFQSDHADLLPELADALAAGLRSYRRVFDAQRAYDPPAADPARAAQPGGPAPLFPRIQGYRCRREISGGGQGTVFEAVHEATGRTVAVKVLTGVSKHAVARFEREAHALAAVSHPGVVAIIDRGLTQHGSYYLAVEYVLGSDLDEWVAARWRRAGSGEQRELVRLFAKVAAALGAAHALGIVHRDVKPSNVRVDALGNPRVIDFGLARLVGEEEPDRRLTVTRDIVGSIHWLSPEQAAGNVRQIGPPSDVYSLGVLMYHAFTGRFPYPVDGPLHSVTRNICEASPADPSTADEGRPGIADDALAAVLLKCLSKKPSDRYPTGKELSDTLEAYLAGTLPTPPRPRPPRRRRRVAGFVCSVVTLTAIGGWMIHRHTAVDKDEVFVVPLPSFTNSIGMEFVELPVGRFQMGSPLAELGHQDDEEPHVVRMTRSFAIARTEVTQAQYLRVMGSLPIGVNAGPADCPIDWVTWDEANTFCQKLSALDGRDYRLPTDAEWEYACRAGTSVAFAGTGRIGDMGWYAGNSGGSPHPVATRQANHWGLFDTHGNVAEWTLDSFVPFLGTNERVDPIHRSGNLSHVVRGGGASDVAENCRSARRIPKFASTPRPGLGFRVLAGPAPVSSHDQ